MTNGREFCIEKLFRGSILNSNSFLLQDKIDTNVKCTSIVTVYAIELTEVERLRAKYVACDKIL